MPSGVPSLRQSVPRVPSSAPKKIRLPDRKKPSVLAPGELPPAPGLMSFTCRVPAAVPSVTQSSPPPAASLAAKKSRPPSSTRSCGKELPSGLMSAIRAVATPSNRHSSTSPVESAAANTTPPPKGVIHCGYVAPVGGAAGRPVTTAVPAAVPSVLQIWRMPSTSVAAKNTWPPTGVNHAGDESPSVPAVEPLSTMSATSLVPPTVPSVIQGSVPWVVSVAAKITPPPKGVRYCVAAFREGFEKLLSTPSFSRTVPAAVPSVTQSEKGEPVVNPGP